MFNQQSISRPRKQRFPGMDRRRVTGSSYTRADPIDEDSVSSEDVTSHCDVKRTRFGSISAHRPYQPAKHSHSGIQSRNINQPGIRVDKRARDEHNEQERSRRRELAVIYELIRCSFSEDDLRHLEPFNGPKSVDKLSYPQVLHVAHHLLKEEQHNLILLERSLNDIKRLEKEFVNIGFSVPERPIFPSVMDNYRTVIQFVDDLLKQDKSARTLDGVYEVSPAQRAALGNRQLQLLRLRPLAQSNTHLDWPETYHRDNAQGLKPLTRTEYQCHRPRSNELPTVSLEKEGYTSVWSRVSGKLKRPSTQFRHADSRYHIQAGRFTCSSSRDDFPAVIPYSVDDSCYRSDADEDTDLMLDLM
ncbi:unnamed protein product [Dicrocoelium dendriticum]|nr:unnamed protein product [Dicrocoelium dendriticum]